MFFRIPEEFFFPVVKVDKLDFVDCGETIEYLKKDTKKVTKKYVGESGILKEADDEYLESEIGGEEKGCY